MTNTNDMSTSWRNWIAGNLQRGCTQQALIESMLQADFDAAFAANCIACVANDVSPQPEPSNKAKLPYQYETSLVAAGNNIDLFDRSVKVSLRVSRPDIVVVDEFMSGEECEQLIEQSRRKLTPSAIVDPQTGKFQVIADRSSEGTYFQRGESPLISRLDRRISELMNWPEDHGEGIQILHYGVGAQYKPHFDYFLENESGGALQMTQSGQRVATLVMYLNEVTEGGETVFPDVGISITPKRGSAAYFAYCNSLGQVDPATLHGGAPVLTGEKWIATKWMRQYKYGS
ncbi:2OG-Fe(II) oxygenase [Methylomonas methanica]|uniref:Procollagen-proline dioxygenase n=1 Tax=Methylomonas methanica (strain DSM 25384 / MC09) TaxID=857087 RepID=F9ZYS1_METMM|nr:2OG-Fe(II) oxygenase [Methylomonas methanica]AEF98617.1 Procollagen-proline dioxygenase [Methylomonas methanica MC09]